MGNKKLPYPHLYLALVSLTGKTNTELDKHKLTP